MRLFSRSLISDEENIKCLNKSDFLLRFNSSIASYFILYFFCYFEVNWWQNPRLFSRFSSTIRKALFFWKLNAFVCGDFTFHSELLVSSLKHRLPCIILPFFIFRRQQWSNTKKFSSFVGDPEHLEICLGNFFYPNTKDGMKTFSYQVLLRKKVSRFNLKAVLRARGKSLWCLKREKRLQKRPQMSSIFLRLHFGWDPKMRKGFFYFVIFYCSLRLHC